MARKLIPEMTGSKFSILNHVYPYYGNNCGIGELYWAFSRIEQRDNFDMALSEFYTKCVMYSFSDVKYVYVNPLTMGYNRAKSFLQWIKGENYPKLVWNYVNNVLFLYSRKKRTVYGFPWGIFDYMGIKRDKVMEMIKSNKSNEIMWTDKDIPKDVRKIVASQRYLEMPLYDLFMGIEKTEKS